MKKKRVLLYIGVAITIAGAGFAGLVLYSLRSFARTPFLAKEQTDVYLMAIKGVAGELMFGELQRGSLQVSQGTQGTGLDALLAPPKPMLGDGLIAAYQRDPKRFKHYSELFDTVVNAQRVGEAAEKNRASFHFAISSSELPLVRNDKFDAWGHPYCIGALNRGLVIVSGGPEAASFSCQEQRITQQEIASATRKIFQTPRGEVVVMLEPKDGPQNTALARPVK